MHCQYAVMLNLQTHPSKILHFVALSLLYYVYENYVEFCRYCNLVTLASMVTCVQQAS